MKMTTPAKLLKWEGGLIPFLLLVSLTALVLVVGVAVADVRHFWSQINTFSCHSGPPPCQLLHMKTISRTCAIIQIKYVLQKPCHLPQYLYGSRDPTTRVLVFASYPGLGTRDRYSYWGRWHSMATHTQSVQPMFCRFALMARGHHTQHQ